jgi:hypothetical protein
MQYSLAVISRKYVEPDKIFVTGVTMNGQRRYAIKDISGQ